MKGKTVVKFYDDKKVFIEKSEYDWEDEFTLEQQVENVKRLCFDGIFPGNACTADLITFDKNKSDQEYHMTSIKY